MKDNKTLLLLTVSLLLIILSVFLLWTWSYRVKAIVATVEKNPVLKSGSISFDSRSETRDSLQKYYNDVLGGINKSIDSVRGSADSLNGGFSGKLAEFNSLKTEINGLLQHSVTDNSVELAELKINELQIRINQLRATNTDISKENERLHSLLAQLSGMNKNAGTSSSGKTNSRPANSSATSTNTPEVSTSDLKLTAISETSNDKEEETSSADRTSRFNASFTVRNNSQENHTVEMVVVLIQPDGKVLQKSTWETGTFDTKEGKKIYSYRTRADFNSGEIKPMTFSVSSDKFLRGIYRMQVYNKGQLIATTSKTIS